MDEYTKNQSLINSIIGEGTRFRGDIELRGLLRIDGDFQGNIKADGRVLIGRLGRAQCLIVVEEGVIIHGYCTVSRDAAVLAAAPSREDELFSVDWGNRINRTSVGVSNRLK